MARVDYWNDVNAPEANSLVVAASAIVTSHEEDAILLHRRVDNNHWALPGGGMKVGESLRDTAIREVLEETGITAEVEYVVGVYSDPNHVFSYDDGEVRQEFSVCVKCAAVHGELQTSKESHEVRWFAVADIDTLAMHPRIRARILDYRDFKRGALNP